MEQKTVFFFQIYWIDKCHDWVERKTETWLECPTYGRRQAIKTNLVVLFTYYVSMSVYLDLRVHGSFTVAKLKRTLIFCFPTVQKSSVNFSRYLSDEYNKNWTKCKTSSPKYRALLSWCMPNQKQISIALGCDTFALTWNTLTHPFHADQSVFSR